MYPNSVSERGKQLVKKAMFLIIAILCAASLYANSYRFSIVWNKTIESSTEMHILEYPANNNAELQNKTKALEIVSTKQGIAKVQYISNEGGIHKLSFTATPLKNNSDPNGYAFHLFFNYTDPLTSVAESEVQIEVGTNKNLEYPNGSIEASMSLNLGTGGSLTPRYIFIEAQLLDQTIDAMQTDVTYSSTIKIERTTI